MMPGPASIRSEEHTSELQSRQYLVCRLLLEKKKKNSERKSRNYSEAQRPHCIILQSLLEHQQESNLTLRDRTVRHAGSRRARFKTHPQAALCRSVITSRVLTVILSFTLVYVLAAAISHDGFSFYYFYFFIFVFLFFSLSIHFPSCLFFFFF